MQRLTVRQQIWVFSGIAATVIILILLFVVYPAVKQIRELQRTIKETHVFLEGRYQAIQKSKKSVTELSDVEEDVATYSQAVIKPGLELEFITRLEKLAEKHKVDQQLSASLIDNPKNISKLRKQKGRPFYQFSFLNRGSFVDHMAYLRELEQSPFYLIIDRIVFEKETTADKKEQIVVRFDGFVYAAHK